MTHNGLKPQAGKVG